MLFIWCCWRCWRDLEPLDENIFIEPVFLQLCSRLLSLHRDRLQKSHYSCLNLTITLLSWMCIFLCDSRFWYTAFGASWQDFLSSSKSHSLPNVQTNSFSRNILVREYFITVLLKCIYFYKIRNFIYQ